MKRRVFNTEISEVLKTATPLVIVELASSIYSLMNTYFVSGLGAEAIAAIGISMYLLTLLQTFTALFSTPALVIASQSLGAGRRDAAREALGELLLYGVLASIVLSILWFYFAPLAISLQSGATGLTYNYAVEYMQLMAIGFPVTLISPLLDSVIVASGYTIYSMTARVTGFALNMLLDPLLIYGLYGLPRLEVRGAALSTILSSLVVLILQFLFLSKLELTPYFSMRREYIARALDLGLPALGERLVFSLGNNVYAGVIARLGDIVMAAHNIGLRVESLIYMPGFAFSTAAASIVGRRMGMGSIKDAKKSGWLVITMGSIVMGILGVTVALTGPVITAPFSPSPEINRLAAIYLVYAGLSELGLGLAMVTSGAIRGAGNTRIPMFINTASLFAVRVTLSLTLVGSMGPHGPWLAMFIDVYARGIALAIVYFLFFERISRRIVS